MYSNDLIMPSVDRLARFLFFFFPPYSSSDSRACTQITLFMFRMCWMLAVPTLKSVGRSSDNQVVHRLNALCVNELWYISRLVRYWSDYTNCSADLPSAAAAIMTAVRTLSMIWKFVSCSLCRAYNMRIPRDYSAVGKIRSAQPTLLAPSAERFFLFKVLLSIRRSA